MSVCSLAIVRKSPTDRPGSPRHCNFKSVTLKEQLRSAFRSKRFVRHRKKSRQPRCRADIGIDGRILFQKQLVESTKIVVEKAVALAKGRLKEYLHPIALLTARQSLRRSNTAAIPLSHRVVSVPADFQIRCLALFKPHISSGTRLQRSLSGKDFNDYFCSALVALASLSVCTFSLHFSSLVLNFLDITALKRFNEGNFHRGPSHTCMRSLSRSLHSSPQKKFLNHLRFCCIGSFLLSGPTSSPTSDGPLFRPTIESATAAKT